jgi:hypothetical protein
MLASAQSMNNTISIFSSNRNIDNTTLPGQTIAHRGIVSFEEPTHVILPPGIEPHGASILPHRVDGASYTGVLTFTATKPVEIGFSHRLHVDNYTLSQLDAETLDDLLIGQQTNREEKGVPGVIAVPSVIIPDYGSTTIFLCVSSFRS